MDPGPARYAGDGTGAGTGDGTTSSLDRMKQPDTTAYARGGIPRAPIISMRSPRMPSPNANVLANPVPMARQMMRYRSQGGPMSRIEKPITGPKFAVNIGKNNMRPFPMPKTESGSMTSPAYS